MKTYLPFLSIIIPIYMLSSARYLAVGYFVGAYATFIYDHKPMYEFSKPYVGPVLDPVLMEMTNAYKRYTKEEEKPKSYLSNLPELPSWFKNPFS
jgi:hypothetical protein